MRIIREAQNHTNQLEINPKGLTMSLPLIEIDAADTIVSLNQIRKREMVTDESNQEA